MCNRICQTKIAYFKEILSSCDNKELYKTVDYLLNRKLPSLPFHDSVETLCNDFSIFFTEKIKKIPSSISSGIDTLQPTFSESDEGPHNIEPLSRLDPATEDEFAK